MTDKTTTPPSQSFREILEDWLQRPIQGEITRPNCPKPDCKKPMVIRKRRLDGKPFWGCAEYARGCGGLRNIDEILGAESPGPPIEDKGQANPKKKSPTPTQSGQANPKKKSPTPTQSGQANPKKKSPTPTQSGQANPKKKSPTPTQSGQETLNKATALFTYLRELVRLRSKVVASLEDYERVLWIDDIPREPECYCAWKDSQRDQLDDIWLRIERPALKPPPQAPATVSPWIDGSQLTDSSLELPELSQQIAERVPVESDDKGVQQWETVVRNLSDFPKIEEQWDTYVEKKWWPWAEEDRRAQSVQSIYTDLFSMYQKQEGAGETFEVVLGLGCLTWHPPSGRDIRRHVIVAQVTISFESKNGLLTVGPAEEVGAKPVPEYDMLEGQERPDKAIEKVIAEQISDIEYDLWKDPSVGTILKSLVHSVSSRGQFHESLTPPGAPGDDPLIHLAPAIILRRRTERSTLKIYDEIIGELEHGANVPPGVDELVRIVDDRKQPSESAHDKDNLRENESQEEILFPLASNQEQFDIAIQLSTSNGILVQGPPGTGKSQTIANLICHLLATGNRVLVTSHTARALKVLKDKIPKEVSALCVTLLGNDITALQSMEDSVQGISDQSNSWKPKKGQLEIQTLDDRLDKVRRQIAIKFRELRELREKDTLVLSPNFGSYTGTMQSIAQRLQKEEVQYSWQTAEPHANDDHPLTNSEALELLQLLRNLDKDKERYLQKHSIDPASITSPSEFITLVTQERDLYSQLSKSSGVVTGDVDTNQFSRCTQDALTDLVEVINHILRNYQTLEVHLQREWVIPAATQILGDRDRAWRNLYRETNERLDTITPVASKVSDWTMTGIDDLELSQAKTDAEALIQHFEDGGKLGWGPFRAPAVKRAEYLVDRIRIVGNTSSSRENLRKFIDWIQVSQTLKLLDADWAPYVTVPTGSFSARLSEYRDLCEPLEIALGLHVKAQEAQRLISTMGDVENPVWHQPSVLKTFQNDAQAQLIQIRLDSVRSSLGQLQRRIEEAGGRNDAHHLIGELAESTRSRDAQRYGRAVDGLSEYQNDLAQLARRISLFDKLSVASSQLASEMESTCHDPKWDPRLAGFTASWSWAQARNWLVGLDDPNTERGLATEVDSLKFQERELVTQLAAAKAWEYCCSRLTEGERQALQAWSQSVRKIGKATGKYTARHRREAQSHMENARSAVPAWIMPIHRVAETIKPGQDLFDVIIVDEASQSGTEALFLSYLATKIVVVGDQHQISPDHVGQNREVVESLRKRYISDLPFSDHLGADNSFFDQALIRYPGRIRLTEHFRCMPEIIQYSNKLCYASEPLIPLRQFGTDHLSPVIVTRYVKDGYLKASRIPKKLDNKRRSAPQPVNPPEALALTDQIIECCTNPDYDGKSMGVITLVGSLQARFIEDLLLKKLGPAEMVKRQIVCGDAYAFQGDERDVIFLSMVTAVSEDRSIGALSDESAKRRFNVAASRAKDQMWLFHSVIPTDLSTKCLRRDLLEYCLDPKIERSEVAGLDLSKLRELARTPNRDRIDLPPPFDSWFEIDVFLKITDRGYRVIPQFEINGRKIDFIVEGMQGRLAVECNGDRWHGPEQYEKDMARQRDLERAGLEFWTVRGTPFFLDPDEAMESLWELLDRRAIYPYRTEPDEGPALVETENSEPDEGPSSPSHTQALNAIDAVDNLGLGTDGPPCPDCGKPTILKISRHQEWAGHRFWACSGYPSCKGLINIPVETLDSIEASDTGIREHKTTEPQRPTFFSTPDATSNIQIAAYQEFEQSSLLDPRTLPTATVMRHLVEIVEVEGPIIARRAYSIYANCAGLRRVGGELRAIFDKAVNKALSEGHLLAFDEWGSSNQQDHVIRATGALGISVRMRGGRVLDQIPPREIAALMGLILAESPVSEEPLFRKVLQVYVIGRLTAKAQEILTFARRICLEQAES